MSTTHTLVFTLQLSTPLNTFNVFDIGLNKKRVNAEKVYFAVEKNIPNRILQLEKVLSHHKKSLHFNLAIPGFLLKLLKERHPKSFTVLKRIVVEHKPEFLLNTYYNSSLHIINDKEISKQIKHEQALLKECFNTQAKLFFSHEHVLSKSLSQALRRENIKGIVYSNSGSVKPINYTNTSLPVIDAVSVQKEIPHTKMDVVSLSQLGSSSTRKFLKELFSEQKLITCSTIFTSLKSNLVLSAKKQEFEFTPLEQNLIKEMKLLYPYVIASDDEQLIAHWRLLANTHLIQQASHILASEEHNPYEIYANYMHIMNDMAHTLHSANEAKKGNFIGKPEILDSPASLFSRKF